MCAFGGIASPAWADWPAFTTVYTGTDGVLYPLEAAIRNTPTTSTYGEVWIAYSLVHVDADRTHNWVEAFLQGYRCQNGIVGGTCGTSTTGSVIAVGGGVFGPHLGHLALAGRKVGANPLDFTVTRRAKVFTDCDGDQSQAGPFGYPGWDPQDQDGADLVAYTFTNPGNLGAFTATGSKTVSVNTAGVCGDRGMTSMKYHGGETWACYSHTPQIGPDAADVTTCNSTVGATSTAWVDAFDLPPPVGDEEDHPNLEFIDADRIVATSHRDPDDHTQDEIRIHFPDHAGANPILLVGGSTWSNHPMVDVHWSQATPGTGLAQMVWHRGLGMGAQLMYSSCALNKNVNPPVLCDVSYPAQWSAPVALASGHDEKYPHIVSDQGYTLIVYTADDPATGQFGDNRVFAISRCGTGAWSAPELVRTNTDTLKDQSMAFGRPGLVLNETGDVAHLVMLDGLTAESTEKEANTNASLYWYRKPYVCAL